MLVRPDIFISFPKGAIYGELTLLIDGFEEEGLGFFFYFGIISGPFGKGPLPSGLYRLDELNELDDIKENIPYKKQGVPWFAKLEPSFDTDRSGLGIHPDGNMVGTKGCVGIVKNDMKLYRILKHQLRKKGILYVQVC